MFPKQKCWAGQNRVCGAQLILKNGTIVVCDWKPKHTGFHEGDQMCKNGLGRRQWNSKKEIRKL